MASILVADDDPVSSLILSRALGRAGHSVAIAATGLEAVERLRDGNFDVLVTDWMMPELDGLELIRLVHRRFVPVPVIIMITCLDSREAQAHVLESGADEFLVKPVSPREAVEAVARGLARHQHAALRSTEFRAALHADRTVPCDAPFPLVAVAANAGGPSAIRLFLRGLPETAASACFVLAQHLQPQMLQALVPVLQRETPLRITLGTHGMRLEPGQVILAPGSHAVTIGRNATIELTQDPEGANESVAVDALFRSAADAFGAACMAVVLTGMGRDGTLGAARVRARGGTVLVAMPVQHVASAMPESVIRAGHASAILPVERLGEAAGQALAAMPLLATAGAPA